MVPVCFWYAYWIAIPLGLAIWSTRYLYVTAVVRSELRVMALLSVLNPNRYWTPSFIVKVQ